MDDKRRPYEKPTLTRIRVEPNQQVLAACKIVTPFPVGCWEAGGVPMVHFGS